MAVEVRDHRLGASLRLAVRPGAERTRVLGEHGAALRLAVAAPPEKGKANKAVLRYLAGELGLARGQVEILSGELSRNKVILCRGLDSEELGERIRKLIEGGRSEDHAHAVRKG